MRIGVGEYKGLTQSDQCVVRGYQLVGRRKEIPQGWEGMLGWFRTLGLGALSSYLREGVGLGAQITTNSWFLNKVQVEGGNRPKLGPEQAWLWGWPEGPAQGLWKE